MASNQQGSKPGSPVISRDDEEESYLLKDKVISVVNLLTKYKIKLWELPILGSGNNTKLVEDLIMKISDESGLLEDELKEILVKLQNHSLKKFQDNQRFSKEGLAVFKLKIIGNGNQKASKSFNGQMEAPITMLGSELKAQIMSKYELDCDSLKIICNGKVVKDDILLQSQEIKNHSTLMVICIYEQIAKEFNKSSSEFKLINDIKDAVNLLSENKIKRSKSYEEEFQLRNQNGVSLDISKQDTRCLTTAMLLHEKAKILIKSKEYLKALILLAESDNEFKNCSDKSLLERTDNYALLNLDIVWCYLCLQNLHELKNAEERLSACEKCLQNCYGADLQRLSYLKTEGVNKHTPIFVRLNLLKAILNYHRGKKKECKQHLDMAKSELQKITIDDAKLSQVMAMGFKSTEARLALRAAYNDVDKAVEQIFKKKQRQKEAAIAEKQKKLNETYGLTQKSNKPIDVKTLRDLMQFGYTEKQAAVALIKSDNEFNLALDFLEASNDTEESASDEPGTSARLAAATQLPAQMNDEVLSQLVAMGYDFELAELCLQAFNGDLQKATNFFLENREIIKDPSAIKTKLAELIPASDATATATGESSTRPSTSQASFEKVKETLEKQRDAQTLLDNIAGEMPEDDEAYLDIDTEEDAFYLNKYSSMLDSFNS